MSVTCYKCPLVMKVMLRHANEKHGEYICTKTPRNVHINADPEGHSAIHTALLHTISTHTEFEYVDFLLSLSYVFFSSNWFKHSGLTPAERSTNNVAGCNKS